MIDARQAVANMIAALKDQKDPFDPAAIREAIQKLWHVNSMACHAAEMAARERYLKATPALENLALFEKFTLAYLAVEELRASLPRVSVPWFALTSPDQRLWRL